MWILTLGRFPLIWRMQMIIETDRWHYKLYKFASEAFNRKWETTNFCTYWRRVLLYAPLMSLLVFAVVAGCMILAAAVTILANLATIPLGYGVVLASSESDFLRIPFRVTVYGEKRSLSKFMVPFWIIVVAVFGLWFGFSSYPDGTVTFFRRIGIIILVVLAVIVLYFSGVFVKEKLTKQHDGPIAEGWHLTKLYLKAKKEKICLPIEFVDPKKEEK